MSKAGMPKAKLSLRYGFDSIIRADDCDCDVAHHDDSR